jgi:hypothetical protein
VYVHTVYIVIREALCASPCVKTVMSIIGCALITRVVTRSIRCSLGGSLIHNGRVRPNFVR